MMSSESSPLTNHLAHVPTAGEIGAALDARVVSGQPVGIEAPPTPEEILARLFEGPPRVVPPPLPVAATAADETQATQSLGKRLAILAAVVLTRFVRWYREDGFWYVTSMTVHAVGLFSLAMISLALPRTIVFQQDAPSFEAPDLDRTPPMEIARFDVGDPPVDPTELNAETLSWTKALPIGGPKDKYYDNSPSFEDAGGGTVMDQKGKNLGGFGGFSIKDLPGPGGRGGVGVGVGFGANGGSGGDNVGFGGRGKGHLQQGATRPSERAVGAALNWLSRHQTVHGKWSIDFKDQCKGGKCSGTGFEKSDAAATAMALLPFLAAGQTHKSKGPYQQTIAKGITWLIKQQRSDGDLSGGCQKPMYAHGLATIALCEAFGMTRDPHIGTAAQQGVAFIERAQNQSTGGWRYQPGDAGDTSVFGWQIMALKSAQLAYLSVNSDVLENAQRWLHSVAKGEHLGLYSYQPYQPVTPTMTAVGMLSRQYLGIDPKDPGMLEGKRSLMENLPDNKLSRNTYYWYYATQAMHNFSDADWDVWNRKMRGTLIETQSKHGCATGSWDPDKPTADAWGRNGGRLMTTSFSTLILEVYYRYLPLFQTDSFVRPPASDN